MHTTLVLGGYGFFGTRISRALAIPKNIRLLIAGRDLQQAQAVCKTREWIIKRIIV